jgi:GNAT superfamily N-acetyltransferase
MKLIPATVQDIPALYDLQLLAFESEAEMIGSRDVPALLESREHHRQEFPNWITMKLVNDEGKIVGAIRYRPDGGIIDVGRLMVHPDYRRQGLAQRMLAEVDRACPDLTRELYTCTKSWINIRLYTKMGYRPVREVTEESGLSFVYMRKP